MKKPALNISEEASVQMPMKTVASLIAMVAIGTWAYFGIIERLNSLEKEPYLTVDNCYGCDWYMGLFWYH